MDHVDRIAPAGRLRKGDEAPSIDSMVQLDDQVIVGTSDGTIRALGFRPNKYGEVIGNCEDGVTSLAIVPGQDGWILSTSGSTVKFWDSNAQHNYAEDEDEDEESSSEEEKRKKKRKKSKGDKSSGGSSAFFADLA